MKDMMKEVAEFGAENVVCEMSMDLMGVRREEIIDYPNISIAGVEASSNEAGRSKVTLFI
jgi:peroxiredoxin family protein